MLSSGNIELKRDFSAGVYQSLLTEDPYTHIGIFDQALCSVATLPFHLVQLFTLPPVPV
jgi:hypothetical protein